MRKYFVYIVENEIRTYPAEDVGSLFITRKQYTELLCNIHEMDSVNALLKYQIFSCGQCRSFSVTAQPLYAILQKIRQNNEIAEILSYNLKEYIEEEDDYNFPYEECVFVFNQRCSCNRILHP